MFDAFSQRLFASGLDARGQFHLAGELDALAQWVSDSKTSVF